MILAIQTHAEETQFVKMEFVDAQMSFTKVIRTLNVDQSVQIMENVLGIKRALEINVSTHVKISVLATQFALFKIMYQTVNVLME